MPPEEQQRVVSGRKRVLRISLIFGAVFSYLYVALFSFRGVPFFRSGDQEFFWGYADRMLSGQVFLKDFYQFTPPGVDLFYLVFFRFFGASIRSTSWAVLLLGIVLTLVCFLIAKRLMPVGFAVVAAFACLLLPYGDRLDATHHWFSSLAAMLAVLVLFQSRSLVRLVVAGALIAVAAFCTQTTGAAALLACCVSFFWIRRAEGLSWLFTFYRVVLIVVSTLLVWLLLSWRFIAEAGWSNYWFFQIVYPRRYVNSQMGDSQFGFLVPPFRAPSNLHSLASLTDHLLVYLILLLACPCVVWLVTRRRFGAADQAMPLMLLSSLGTCLMLEVIARLNWNRLDAMALPATILCVWMLSRLQRFERVLLPLSWCLVGLMAVAQPLVAQLHYYQRLTLPTGLALFQSQDAAEFEWFMQHTVPGEPFFAVGTTSFYLPLKLTNPTAVDLLLPFDTTRPEWVPLAISRLEQTRVKYVLWAPAAILRRVDDPPISKADHLGPLRSYLKGHFARVKVFPSGDEIWQRIDDVASINSSSNVTTRPSQVEIADVSRRP